MKKLSLLVAMVVMVVGFASAQRIKKTRGDISKLKGISELNVVFVYDNMKVGKNLTEEEYIEEKVKDYNEDEAGKGDKWKENWIGNRVRTYHPKFIELFNKTAKKAGITVKEDIETDYTLEVHTYYTEPGWNIGIAKAPAYINVKYVFIDNSTGKTVAEFDQQKVPGSQAAGFDFDVGTRISESYAKAGKSLAKMLAKEFK